MSTLQSVPQRSSAQLATLVKHRQADSISCVMPTYQSGRRVSQNAIQFKNLLRQVVERLIAKGEPEEQTQRRLAALFDLQRDDEFWQHQRAGLAVYFANENLTTIGLHESPEQVVYVADHFFVTPAALDAADHQRFSVLTLSWEEAELWEADRYQLSAADSQQFPVRLRDVVLPPDPEEQLQFRTQQGGNRNHGNGDAMFHGQGEGEGTMKADRCRFLSEVGRRVNGELRNRSDSLIVVATSEVLGHLQAETELEPVHSIGCSPAQLGDSQLQRLVLDWINADGQGSLKDRTAVKERLGTAVARGQGSEDLTEIVSAATQGRISQLFVDPRQRIWSEGHDQDSDGSSIELINWAVINTLQAGGEVFPITDADRDCAVAAIFRY